MGKSEPHAEIIMEVSNSQKSLSPTIGELVRPVWSKQHGAYITLISSWLIGTLLSQSFTIHHIVVLLLLLSGFNGTELFVDSMKRRSPQSQRRWLWMGVYGVAAISMAYVIWQSSPLFQTMLPVLAAGGLFFIFLSIKRLHKTIPAELITFMFFSAAGLLAYNPAHMPDTGFIVNLWILISAYFCLSVFHVKYRIKEITAKLLVGYILIAVAIILFTAGFSVATLLVSTLIVFKTVPLLAAPKAYRALKIKHIGYLEMVMQGVLVLIVVLSFGT